MNCLSFFCLQESEYPGVVIGIFIQQPTPFVTAFFERLLNLKYPKNRLQLFIYNQVKYYVQIYNYNSMHFLTVNQ